MRGKQEKIITFLFLIYFAFYVFSPTSVSFRVVVRRNCSAHHFQVSPRNITLLLLENARWVLSSDEDSDNSGTLIRILLAKKKALFSSTKKAVAPIFINIAKDANIVPPVSSATAEISFLFRENLDIGSGQDGFHLINSSNSPPQYFQA